MSIMPPPRSKLVWDEQTAEQLEQPAQQLPVQAKATDTATLATDDALELCRKILANLPPMAGAVKYQRAWSIENALDQHQCLLRQHDLQTSIGQGHMEVRRLKIEFLRLRCSGLAQQARLAVRESLAPNVIKSITKELSDAARTLEQALKIHDIEEIRAEDKTRVMEEEIEKSNTEMVILREAIDDVVQGGGPPFAPPLGEGHQEVGESRKVFYCSDCHVGGHGQRFCLYFLQRPNWRVYPSEKWFEDKSGHTSYCPLGKRCVDFTDETHFSRISMHIKGRMWLEDKRLLYEFVSDVMPLTYVIHDQQWVGQAPPPEPPGAPPMPWFVKETDRNWGTSVMCCTKPEECLSLAKEHATYVVQKHISKPLLYENGEKCHIKFYNLLLCLADGVTWRLYTYRDGYLCISPKPWSPTDVSKETQVTIIRTKRINDWPHWPKVYPKCCEGVKTVIQRAAEEGKLIGRNKVQFEIISADFMANEDLEVYLLEFNTGPVLRDPEESPDVHDGDMVRGALHLVEPWEGGSPEQWDFVLECQGQPPKPDDQLTVMSVL